MRTKQQQETRRNRPNLRTIAERVDLSPTAVSLALRGDSSIPLETRQRVLTAAEELDYKYIPRSRKSGQKRLRRLVFVIHDYGDQSVTANPFYGHILTGVEQACRQKHASLSFVVLQHDYPKTTALPPVLTHELDGILLTSPYPPELIKRISREASGQIVLIDNIYPGSPYDSVMADDFGGAYLATQHLIACGHQQIVLLTGTIQHPTIIPSFQQRYWGYCAACSAAGISPLPPAVFPAHLDQEILTIGGKQEGVQEWLMALIKHYSPRPTAFFGVCDLFALTALRVLQNLGWRIPEDFSVIGFDDYDISSMATPPLTTVHSYQKALAWVAVERLLARIEGEEAPPQYLTLGTDLIVRKSTGLPPKMC